MPWEPWTTDWCTDLLVEAAGRHCIVSKIAGQDFGGCTTTIQCIDFEKLLMNAISRDLTCSTTSLGLDKDGMVTGSVCDSEDDEWLLPLSSATSDCREDTSILLARERSPSPDELAVRMSCHDERFNQWLDKLRRSYSRRRIACAWRGRRELRTQ